MNEVVVGREMGIDIMYFSDRGGEWLVECTFPGTTREALILARKPTYREALQSLIKFLEKQKDNEDGALVERGISDG